MKKIFILLLIFTLLFSTVSFAAQDQYMDYAEKLQAINVFVGTGNGFELNRPPTRLESGIMFVRLIGAEEEAIAQNYPHPFTDVPAWGNPYVGYMYHNSLTFGISETEFGASNQIQAKSYLTFVLRALGYSDSLGDFSWNEAVQKSEQLGLINASIRSDLNSQVFLRDHVAKLSYDALKQQLKDDTMTLAQQLVQNGAIDAGIALQIGVLGQATTSDWILTSVEKILPETSIDTPSFYTYKNTYEDFEGYPLITHAMKEAEDDSWPYTLKLRYSWDQLPEVININDTINLEVSVLTQTNVLGGMFQGMSACFEIRVNNYYITGLSGESYFNKLACDLIEGNTLSDTYPITFHLDLIPQGNDFTISIFTGHALNVQYDYHYTWND